MEYVGFLTRRDAHRVLTGEGGIGSDDEPYLFDRSQHRTVCVVECRDERVTFRDRVTKILGRIVTAPASISLIHERFREDAPDIDTGVADHIGRALDQCDARAFTSERTGYRLACLTPADDKDFGVQGFDMQRVGRASDDNVEIARVRRIASARGARGRRDPAYGGCQAALGPARLSWET